jgi:hypothetical protein
VVQCGVKWLGAVFGTVRVWRAEARCGAAVQFDEVR